MLLVVIICLGVVNELFNETDSSLIIVLDFYLIGNEEVSMLQFQFIS